MRVRQHPPGRHLETGTDPDLRWNDRTCATNQWIWDYEIHGESRENRRERHREAIRGCLDCPALDLCRAMNHAGAAGVIAGKVVTG